MSIPVSTLCGQHAFILYKVDFMHFLLENFVLQAQTDLQVLQSAQDGDGNV